jgi:hypothetical protein
MIYFLLAFFLFAAPVSAQVFPPMTLTSPEIPGNNVDEDGDGTYDEAPTTSIVVDSDVAGQYHWHFRNCDKTIFQNTADVTFVDEFRVDKPTGSLIAEGQIVCYIPNLPAATYTLYVQYSTPSGTRAIWPAVNKNLAFSMRAENASILPFITTPQWIKLIYTGTAANFYAGANGGDTVSFVWPGGAFAMVFKADDMRLACGYLATGATPTLRCPGEGDAEAPAADYVMLEKGAETTPTAFNSAAFTHANVMQFTGTEIGVVCASNVVTVKGLWDDAATDRQYWSIVCEDTDDETVTLTNDVTTMPSANEDRVDIRWRADQSAVLDTNAYMITANLQPVYFDADWSGTANARNPAVNLNTTVVRNVIGATSWNIFIAADLGSNIVADTIGLLGLAVQDKDAGVSGANKYFHGSSIDVAQWGTIQWAAATVAASGGGGDETAPVVTSPAIPAGTIEQTSFIMTAATGEAGTCRVRYGLTDGSHTWTTSGTPSVNGICTVSVINSVSTPVVAGTEYWADMQVCDAAPNCGDSTEVGPITTDGAVTECTHFASPTGTGDGLSVGKPYKIQNFTQSSHAAPGAVLCLASGNYTGIEGMIQPTTGKNGTALNPIKIKASTDGGPWIQGQAARTPVSLNNNDFWILEGFDASDSDGAVVVIWNGSSNNIIRRVCAWDSNPAANTRVWGVTGDLSVNNVIEDSCGFGVGRRIFAIAQGGPGTILRRTWAAYTKLGLGGPESAYQFAYNSHTHTLENVIGTWKQAVDGDSNTGEASIVHLANEGHTHKVLGSMFYVKTGDLMDPSRIFRTDFGGTTAHGPIEIRDTIIYSEQAGKIPWTLTTGASCTNCTITNTTEVGGTASNILSSWTQTNRGDYANLAAMNTATANPFLAAAGNGGRMCFRYINKAITTQKLWPWPMDARINAALVRAGRDPDDYFGTGNELTEYLESVFGTIPAACKA